MPGLTPIRREFVTQLSQKQAINFSGEIDEDQCRSHNECSYCMGQIYLIWPSVIQEGLWFDFQFWTSGRDI